MNDGDSEALEALLGDQVDDLIASHLARTPRQFSVASGELLLALQQELTFEILRDQILNSSKEVFVFFRDRGGVAKQIKVSGKAALDLHASGYTIYFVLERECTATKLCQAVARLLDEDADHAWPAVFLSKRGAITAMHFDAGDGLTIQLAGRKVWTVGANPLSNPPGNFTAGEPWTGQLASLQIEPPTPPARSALRDFELAPGDALLATAGAWHQVECLEDSISVDLNLRPTSSRWTDALAQGFRRLLTRIPAARTHWGFGNIRSEEDAARIGDEILEELRRDLHSLSGKALLLPTPYDRALEYIWNPLAVPSIRKLPDTDEVELSIEIVGFYSATGTLTLPYADAVAIGSAAKSREPVRTFIPDNERLVEALCALQAIITK
jgi:hypothetical protein